MQNISHFIGKEVVVTEKLDGENTTLYTDYMHARSTHYRHHISRDWVKRLHSRIAHHIPADWRLCGENVYAKHSLFYDNLESYFYLFSIWNEQNECLDWYQTLEWANLLNLKIPREFYRGVWNQKKIDLLPINTDLCEGYVIRTIEKFPYISFDQHVAKWVRKEHVTTDDQWLNSKITVNLMTPSSSPNLEKAI